MRRRKGATLGLVALATLLLIVLGIAFFFLTKLLGGSRELQHSSDAGTLNIAKQSLQQPRQALSSFPNTDVASNFALLSDNGNANLLCYNAFVGQAAIVAMNAKDMQTPQAAADAKKVWKALNDVGEYLRGEFELGSSAQQWFDGLAGKQSLKMLDSNGGTMTDYGVAYMRRGGPTNIYIDDKLLSALGPQSTALPRNTGSLIAPSGFKYLAGYQPITVDLSSGDRLTFSGVPVFPQSNPHLVSTDDFSESTSDSFATAAGYPERTLPPNAFKASGRPTQGTTQKLWAIACAVVGIPSSSQWTGQSMSIPGGYIEIRNGPSAPRPGKMPANKAEDIFAHELGAVGIYTQGSNPSDMFTQNFGLPAGTRVDEYMGMSYTIYGPSAWDQWYEHNVEGKPQPDLATSQKYIRKGDGTAVTIDELKTINTKCTDLTYCRWTDYDEPSPEPVCVDALENFKIGYNRPGSQDSGHVGPDGLTTLEQFKLEVLGSRYDVKTCAMVEAPNTASGVKWFDDSKVHYAPGKDNIYNFGEIRTPYDYLDMIDKRSPGTMADVLDKLWQRCREIKPSCARVDVENLLKAKQMPLGASLYIYSKNNTLTIDKSPPSWAVPGTTADGAPQSHGTAYDVNLNHINACTHNWEGDGEFDMPYAKFPDCKCTDRAIVTLSTGYNNLLGELRFTNTCEGGGKFCQPN